MTATDKPTIAELITSHVETGVQPAARDFAAAWSSDPQDRPLLQYVLLALGTIIAAPILGFLIYRGMELLGLDVAEYQAITGAILLSASIFLRRRRQQPGNLGAVLHSLMVTTTFIVGTGLMIYGLGVLAGKIFVIPLCAVAVTLIAGHFFGRGVGYAICLFFTLTSIPLLALADTEFTTRTTYVFFGTGYFAALMLALTGGIIRPLPIMGETPALRAVAAAAVAILTIRIAFNYILPLEAGPVQLMYLPGVSVVLAVASLCLLVHLGGGWRALRRGPLLTSGLAAIALALLNTPGILLGLILLVTGYHRADRFLITLGAVQIPCYLFQFYYNLEVDLLQKSGLLILGGVILLAGYGWIIHRMRGAQS